MTPSQLAASVCRKATGPINVTRYACNSLESAIEDAIRLAVVERTAEIVRIVESQPYYSDTHTGMRQQWIKDQIAEKIRALHATGERE